MTQYLLPFLLLFVSTGVSAQTVRHPEPVPSAAPQMFEQLKTGDYHNWIPKAEALDYLSRYNVPGAQPAVQKILDDKHPNNRWLRGRAVVAMARIDPDNAATLAQTHTKDPHVEVRAAVAEVCADLPKDAAMPILEILLAEKTPPVQFGALAAYARHQGLQAWVVAEPMTADVPDDCIEPVALALGLIGTEASLARLLELAEQPESIPALLRGINGLTAPKLAIFYLDLIAAHETKVPLADAWQAMQHLEREQVIGDCLKAVASGDERYVRVVARLVAQYLNAQELGEALQLALQQSTERSTLQVGLAALSCLEADQFQEFFIAKLAHEDAQIRKAAVRCLAQCKEVNLYEALEAILGDADSTVRVAALESLHNTPIEQAPSDRIIEYFTPSLLSEDTATRKAAIASFVPHVTMDNGEAALVVMQQLQSRYGTEGTEPLMHAVFRMVPEEKSAEILEAHGYVVRWHVIGTFPAGFMAPEEDIDGLATVYPPERKVDLTEEITVAYNSQGDTRFAKKPDEQTIRWVEATVANADGMLFLTKTGRSQLQLPRKHGASYAFTEINITEQTEVRFSFLLSEKSQDRVWLNEKVLELQSQKGKDEGTVLKTAAVTLPAGKNRILVKVVSDDHSQAWWAPKISTRGFRLSLTDLDGKPVKWSNE